MWLPDSTKLTTDDVTGGVARADDEASPELSDRGEEITRVVPVKLIEALREASRASEVRRELGADASRYEDAADELASTTDARGLCAFDRTD